MINSYGFGDISMRAEIKPILSNVLLLIFFNIIVSLQLYNE